MAKLAFEQGGGPCLEEVTSLLVAEKLPDTRERLGAVRCRDGGEEVEPHELHTNPGEGDRFIDGSCFGGEWAYPGGRDVHRAAGASPTTKCKKQLMPSREPSYVGHR